MKVTRGKFIAIIFCFFIFFQAKSQLKRQVDSILAVIPKVNDTSKAMLYFYIADRVWEADINRSINYAKKGIEISRKSNFLKGEARGYEIVGMLEMDLLNFPQGLNYLLKSYKIIKENNLPKESAAATLITMARIFKYYGYEEIALNYADSTFKILNDIKPKPDLVYVYNQLANYYLENNKPENALEIINKLTIYEEDSIENLPQKMAKIMNQAKYYRLIGDIKKAKETAEYSKSLADDSVKYNNGMFLFTEDFLAKLYVKEQKYDSAIYIYLKSIDFNKSPSLKKWLALNYRDLAEVYILNNEWGKAKKYANKYLEISLKEKYSPDDRTAYKLLSKIANLQRDYKNEAYYIRKYSDLSDSASLKERSVIIQNVYLQNKLDESIFINNKLFSENEKKSSIIKDKQILQLILILVSCVVFIFTIVIIYFFVQYRITNDILKNQSQEILQKNNQLETQNQLLTELNEEVNGIIGIVSHDLKAPVSRIESFLKFVEMENNINSHQKEYIDRALAEVENSKSMIKKILETESNTVDVKLFYAEVNIHELLLEAFEKYKLMAHEKEIELFLKDSLRFEKTKIDKEQLLRILDNLVSNAVKFSNRNKKIFINAYEKSKKMVIEVVDEGPGISSLDRKHIFKKYQKLSAKPTEGENSTGLGLYIVKKLVKRLGGEIEVVDNHPNGAIFRVIL